MLRTSRFALLVPVLLLLFALPVGAASVTVAWDPNPEPNVRYVVYWGTQSGSYGSSAAAGSTTSFVVSGLLPGQVYYFAVQALTLTGVVSPLSEEVSTLIPALPTTLSGYSEQNLNWRVVARADFDADGRVDIVWRNAATGENRVWYLRGDAFVRSDALPEIGDSNWEIVAAADFNRDGKPDLVWHNRATGSNLIWYMDGSSFVRAERLRSLSDTAWNIVAVADFNVDGSPDLLWRHAGTGENAVWFMDGEATYEQAVVLRVADPAWRIVVADDFNRDGYPDLVWWNAASGQTVLWEMRGALELSHTVIDSVADTNWRPVASGDFDANGEPELVWRDGANGRNEIRRVSAPAQLFTPLPGSVVGTSSVTLGWTPGSGVSQIALYVGTGGPGSYDIYFGVQGTAVSRTLSGLPSNGATLYARLWSCFEGTWRYIDYTYRASVDASLVELSSPVPGSNLAGPTATFAWAAGKDVSNVALYVGTSGVGSYDVYHGYQDGLSRTVSGLPIGGNPVYVRLWSAIPGGWQYLDYIYNSSASGDVPAAMIAPASGNTLTSSTATFRWTTGNNVEQVALYAGTTGPGSYDLYYASEGTSLSKTMTGLPTNGSRIYVRLWSRLPTGWRFVDYTYTAKP
jgi:hypothetical protein